MELQSVNNTNSALEPTLLLFLFGRLSYLHKDRGLKWKVLI